MAVWQNPERKVWTPPQDEVSAAPSQQEEPANQETPYKPQGWGSVAGDVGRMALGALPEAVQSIPGIVKGAGNLAFEVGQNPIQPGKINPRIAAAAAIGIPDFIRNVLNQPGRAANYLGEKGIVSPETQQLGQRMQVPETGLMERFLGQTSPGEEFAHGLAPFILARKQLATHPATTTGAIAGIEGDNPFAGALLGKAAQKTGEAIGGLKNEYQNRKALKDLQNEGNTYGDEIYNYENNLNEIQQKLPTYDQSIKSAREQAAQSVKSARAQTSQSAQELQKATELQEQATSTHPDQFEQLQNEKFQLQEEGIEASAQKANKLQEIAQQELAQERQALAAQQEQARLQQEAQQNLDDIKYETGHASSRVLNNKIRSNQESLDELNQQIAQAPDISHLPQAEKIFAESEKQLSESEKQLFSNEYKLNKMLGEGSAHNMRVAKIIFDKQSAVEDGISKEYNDIGEASKDYNIPLNENPELVQLEKDLRGMSPNATDAEFAKLFEKASKQLGVAPEKSVPAKEYLQKWRSKRNQGYNLQRQGNEKGGSATEEGKMLRDAGQAALDEADAMLETYKKHVPEDVSGRLMAVNEEFRTKVAPLKTSPTWRAIEYNKKIPGKDLVEKFLGESPDIEILRAHILSDPIASDLMLGSRMAGKPNTWNEYHEASMPYLENASPQTRELLKQHVQLNEAIPKIKETAKQSQKAIKELTPAKTQLEANQKEFNSTKKELEKWKKELAQLKEAEKAAKEAKKVRRAELKDFTAEKTKIKHEAAQEKLNRSKKMTSLERKKMTLQQVEAEHKAETARKNREHQQAKEKSKQEIANIKERTQQEITKLKEAKAEDARRAKEEEAKIEAADKERAEKIKEAESKVKFNKDKIFSLAKKMTHGVGMVEIMKMLIG